MTNSRKRRVRGGKPAKQRRIDRAIARGEYTPVGTPPNGPKKDKA